MMGALFFTECERVTKKAPSATLPGKRIKDSLIFIIAQGHMGNVILNEFLVSFRICSMRQPKGFKTDWIQAFFNNPIQNIYVIKLVYSTILQFVFTFKISITL